MRIRTQLILAAFVLAVIPLAAIVTYSYHSSRRALESAYRREADRQARQMDRRLTAIRADLDQRLTLISSLPLPSDGNVENGRSIVTVMGDAASLVDSLEFQPVRMAGVEAPDRVEIRADAEPAPVTQPPPPSEPADAPTSAALADATAHAIAPQPPHPPMPRHASMVIDLPPMPEVPLFVMSDEQKELVEEIGRLGMSLGRQQLSPEEREEVRKELKKSQDELNLLVAESGRQLGEQVREATRVRREREALLATARTERAAERAAERERFAAPDPATRPHVRVAPAPVAAPSPVAKVAATPKAPSVSVRKVTDKDVEKGVATARKTSLILGRKFEAPIRKEGELVGQLTARISPEEVVRRILGNATEESDELPFAVDREGTMYTRNDRERAQIDRLGIPERLRQGQPLSGIEGWIVTTSTDAQSGLRIGVARPVGANLDELRSTAARNFSLGMGLIAFALIGIVPLTNHLTRDVKLVTEGAERIAHGDLMTRLPVKTKNELGQLARAFNRMAEDLSHQQQRLLEQERARKEQELQQRLMKVEYERKSIELEDARVFQLSMLPKEVPHHPAYDVAVYTRTATEVGGDYYDFHVAGDVLSVTIGDATGHGAKAGTMVTVVKTLFAGYGGATGPAAFLIDAADKIKRMELGRMAMALSIGRFEPRALTLSSAGMPPVLLHRASTAQVEEVALNATPLGTLGSAYDDRTVPLAPGDTVLFLSDGFPELMNDTGQQLGYGGALDAFGEAARGATAGAVIDALAALAAQWHGDAAPNDDVTFVVVRVA